MPIKGTRAAWIAALTLCLASAAAHAQSAEAESLFAEGDKLMKQGKLAAACEAFEASNRIEARAGTLIRIGKCRESNHQLASAWSAYKDALTRVKDPKKKTIAMAKVAELEPKLSYLTLRIADRIDGLQVTRNGQPVDPGEWDHAVAVDGGAYAIAAHAPDHRDWEVTINVPESAGKIVVDVPKLNEGAGEGTPPTTTPTTTPGKPTRPIAIAPAVHSTEAPSMWTGRRKIAVVAAGVAVLGVAGGVVFGMLANHARDDANRLCPQHVCATGADATTATNDLHTAQGRALDANIAFGVAAVAVIGAGALWVTGAPERTHGVAIAPGLAPGMVSLTIAGGF